MLQFVTNYSDDLRTLSEELNQVHRLLDMDMMSGSSGQQVADIVRVGLGALYSAFGVIDNFYSRPNVDIGDKEYHLGQLVVAQVIWIHRRIVHILKYEGQLPIHVSFFSSLLCEMVGGQFLKVLGFDCQAGKSLVNFDNKAGKNFIV